MQNYFEIIRNRRSYYNLSEGIDLSNEEVKYIFEDILNTTPSAMNSQPIRVVLLFDDKSKEFWTKVNETYDNKIDKDKFHGFYHAKGTALYFIDDDVVRKMEKDIPSYADRMEQWAEHACAMIQLNAWQGLRDENIGASLQHYNPHIDKWVRELYGLPENFRLVAQMPFGKIEEEPEEKEKASMDKLLKVFE